MLITFEGLPESGKAEQIRMLKKRLVKENFPQNIVETQEPGWNRNTSGILKFMAHEGETCDMERLFLYLADRAGHFARFIRPIMENSQGRSIILCNGGPDSTLAFQGFAAQLAPINFLSAANQFAMKNFPIKRTYLLRLDPKTSVERCKASGKMPPILKSDPEFFDRVNFGFKAILEKNKERVLEIDANQSADAVHEAIFEDIKTKVVPYEFF